MPILPKWLSEKIFGKQAEPQPTQPESSYTPPGVPVPGNYGSVEANAAYRENEARDHAKALLRQRHEAREKRPPSMEEIPKSELFPNLFDAEGLIFAAGGRLVSIDFPHQHMPFRKREVEGVDEPVTQVLAERLEFAGQVVAGDDLVLIYDPLGAVYVGPRYQEEANGKIIDSLNDLKAFGYEEVKQDRYRGFFDYGDDDGLQHRPSTDLIVTDASSFIFGQLEGYIAPPAEEMKLDFRLYQMYTVDLGRRIMSEVEFNDRVRKIGRPSLPRIPKGPRGGTGGSSPSGSSL